MNFLEEKAFVYLCFVGCFEILICGNRRTQSYLLETNRLLPSYSMLVIFLLLFLLLLLPLRRLPILGYP